MNSIRTIVFTDLDDTLIQTVRKLPEHALTTLGATDRQGKALTFFTQSQQTLLDLFRQQGAFIIPITGRNTDALNRVHYDFQGFCSVSHGAVVLKNKTTICPHWLNEIDTLLMDWPDLLSACNKEIEQIIKHHKLDARTRVIIDMDIPAYISVKGTVQDLAIIKQNNDLGISFRRHENGRNHALLPPYASKKKAVEYIKKQLGVTVNDLTIGIGDSLSDIEFMKSCQFSMLPSQSQIAKEYLHV
jgi:hydroxymethylpyrimidine pyrophosphatase-like HAD family hydrolase